MLLYQHINILSMKDMHLHCLHYFQESLRVNYSMHMIYIKDNIL